MVSPYVLISLSNTRNEQTKYMFLFHLLFLLCTTIRPRIMVLIDLFLLFAHGHSTKMYGPLSFILSFANDNSTKNCGSHWFTSFICTQSFDQNIWSFLLKDMALFLLFYAGKFDQKLCYSLIYFFYLQTTIRPKYMFLFPFVLSFCKRPFNQKIWSFLIYSFFCAWPFDQNLWSSLIYLHMTKISSFIFFLARPFDQN